MTDWLQRTRRTTLPDGLTVLTHYLPNSEVTALHFCVKAGYFCETIRKSGWLICWNTCTSRAQRVIRSRKAMGVRLKALGGMLNAIDFVRSDELLLRSSIGRAAAGARYHVRCFRGAALSRRRTPPRNRSGYRRVQSQARFPGRLFDGTPGSDGLHAASNEAMAHRHS